jgi:hypothetical protein
MSTYSAVRYGQTAGCTRAVHWGAHTYIQTYINRCINTQIQIHTDTHSDTSKHTQIDKYTKIHPIHKHIVHIHTYSAARYGQRAGCTRAVHWPATDPRSRRRASSSLFRCQITSSGVLRNKLDPRDRGQRQADDWLFLRAPSKTDSHEVSAVRRCLSKELDPQEVGNE